MSISAIEDFIERKRHWIEKHTLKTEERSKKSGRKEYTEAEIHKMQAALSRYIVPRVAELWTGQ
jgi:Protein of unknown function DUF45